LVDDKFERLGSTRVILKNLGFMSVSQVLSRILGMVILVYLARVLQPAAFGQFNFALSIISFFSVVAVFGLDTVGTRALCQNNHNLDIVPQISTLKMVLGVSTLWLVLVFLWFINKTWELKLLIFLCALSVPVATFFDWVFQGLQRMQFNAFSSIITQIIFLAFLFIFVNKPDQVILVPIGQFFAYLVPTIFLGYILFTNININSVLKYTKKNSLYLIKQSVPLVLTNIINIIVLQLIIIIVGFLNTDIELGYFTAAYRIVLILLILEAMIGTAVFPAVCSSYVISVKSANVLIQQAIKWLLLLSIPPTIIIAVFSREIVLLLYGSSYISMVPPVLSVIIWTVPISFINSTCARAMVAYEKEYYYLLILVFIAIITIIISVSFSYFWGLTGASMVPVLIQTLSFPMYYLFFIRHYAVINWPLILKITICSLIMATFLMITYNFHSFLWAIFGMIIFYASSFLFKAIGLEDLEVAKETLLSATRKNNIKNDTNQCKE